jgi:membrane fusion protein (multidrug efflux system)
MLAADAPALGKWAWAILFLYLAGWAIWFGWAEIGVHAATPQARIEVDSSPHRVEAPHHSGLVTATHLDLGRQVQAGEVLLELEDDVQRGVLAAELSRERALKEEVETTRKQAAAQEAVVRELQESNHALLAETRALLAEAEAAANKAEADLVRGEQLAARNLIAAQEIESARFLLAEKQAAADAFRAREMRIREDAAVNLARAELSKTMGKLSHLEGEVRIASTSVAVQTEELHHHHLRAPVRGRIADVMDIEVGSFVRPGEWICTIVPDGALRVVAFYTPSDALGRVQIGQRGRLRLHGFPWPAYGAVTATVSAVAGEPRDGRIRVELSVAEEGIPRGIPRQHGLPGTLEVELERTSPMTLVLRAVGKRISPGAETERAAHERRPAGEESPGESSGGAAVESFRRSSAVDRDE